MSIELRTTTSLCSVTTSALLNSGATGMFVNQAFAQKHKLEAPAKPSTSSQCRWNSKREWIHHGGSQGHTPVWPTHGESTPCSCQPQMADHHHWAFMAYPSQSGS